jgi:hypothetical protein
VNLNQVFGIRTAAVNANAAINRQVLVYPKILLATTIRVLEQIRDRSNGGFLAWWGRFYTVVAFLRR